MSENKNTYQMNLFLSEEVSLNDFVNHFRSSIKDTDFLIDEHTRISNLNINTVDICCIFMDIEDGLNLGTKICNYSITECFGDVDVNSILDSKITLKELHNELKLETLF